MSGGQEESGGEIVLLLAAFSFVAGLIHVEAAVIHFGHIWYYGVSFVVLAAFQFAWAWWVYDRCSDRVLRLGMAVSAATIAVWVVSRTVGVPFGPEAWQPESVGLLDVAAGVDELVIVALGAAALRGRAALLTGSDGLRAIAFSLLTLTLLTVFLGGHRHGG